MKRLMIFTFSLFAVLCVSSQTFRVQEGLSFASTILRQDIAYSVILPEKYFEAEKSYPVIYFLHGLGDNESSWLEYGQLAQYCDRMISQSVVEPFICIMPEGFSSYYSDCYDGSFSYQQMFINELVPYIDSHYRTIAQAGKRAIIGYSMGGFGALVLPIKYSDVFKISIPLSASIRTDAQYMFEEQAGWNEQWGRIFGGLNTTGKERITQYYIENSPFHLIKNNSSEQLSKVHFYIVNGDKENTLCRSNEELHMLLLEKRVPHIYNVKSGGHEFSFWRDALPEAICFADAKFRNKEYVKTQEQIDPDYSFPKRFESEQINFDDISLRVVYPQNRNLFSRLYPVIYFVSDLNEKEQNSLINQYEQKYILGELPPVIFSFVPEKNGKDLQAKVIPYMEKNSNAREGRHFRAVWGYKNSGNTVLKQAFKADLFTVACFTNTDLFLADSKKEKLNSDKKIRDQLWLYIDTPSANENYVGNGLLHIFLRENKFTHEYRSRNEKDGFNYLLSGFIPVLTYICKKFHH
jgi:enterochelin esterase-like enzyme